MTLNAFVLFVLGILSELIFLYESAASSQPGSAVAGGGTGSRLDLDRPAGLRVAAKLSPTRQALAILGLLAALLVGAFEGAGVGGQNVYIDSPGIGWLFVLLGVGLLFTALAANLFLPRVSEAGILIVQGLVLLGALSGGSAVDWLPLAALAVVPTVVSLALLAWRLPLPPAAKAVLYLWYLISLLALPFLSGQAASFSRPELTWLEAYASGMVFVFLLVHGLFVVRFGLIVSALLLPRNRPPIARLMPRLFSDERAPRLRFALVVVLVAGLLLANRALELVPQSLAVGVCALLGVQLLGNRPAEGACVGR